MARWTGSDTHSDTNGYADSYSDTDADPDAGSRSERQWFRNQVGERPRTQRRDRNAAGALGKSDDNNERRWKLFVRKRGDRIFLHDHPVRKPLYILAIVPDYSCKWNGSQCGLCRNAITVRFGNKKAGRIYSPGPFLRDGKVDLENNQNKVRPR